MTEPGVDAPKPQEDIYAYQRSELLDLLKTLADRHEPLVANGEILLRPDDVYVILQKIHNHNHFSRKEKHALTEAGFNLPKLFPWN